MIISNVLYQEDVKLVAELDLDWEILNNSTILITGASGLIGSFLIDVLMMKNKKNEGNFNIVAMSRNEKKAKKRFGNYFDSNKFTFISADINEALPEIKNVNFIIHAASNTHPLSYSNDPIGTIMTNISGTFNILNLAKKCKTKRTLFTSSVEVYGENRGDVEMFDEEYCGYIDCNTLRAGYPESKRTGESLCQAFIKKYDLDIVIARLSRTYGPTMLNSDSKAISQFIKNAVNKEDIVLKSDGMQYYSYNYVADSASGILNILLKGKNGEAYNISDDRSNVKLKDLAILISKKADRKVIFKMPENNEAVGYSKATKALMNSKKLKSLGWKASYEISGGVDRTIDILVSENSEKLKQL